MFLSVKCFLYKKSNDPGLICMYRCAYSSKIFSSRISLVDKEWRWCTHAVSTAPTWSAYPSYATKSSALQHQPLSLWKAARGWQTRSNHGKKSLQAPKGKFKNGDQNGKDCRSTGATKTALELWHGPEGWMRETEQHPSNISVKRIGSWISGRCLAEGASWRKERVSQYNKQPWEEMGDGWMSGKTEKGEKGVFYSLWVML